MTKDQLKFRIYCVMLYVMALLAIAGVSLYKNHNSQIYTFIKDLSSLLIALPAAYLTYMLQKRQAFLESLRELWKDANEAKGELVQYTHLSTPTSEDFSKAHKSISKSIDSVRAVYCNVRESERYIGLYPFEPLHDMRRALEKTLPCPASKLDLSSSRREMIVAWNTFRYAFLREFQAPAPPFPILSRGFRDPRRKLD